MTWCIERPLTEKKSVIKLRTNYNSFYVTTHKKKNLLGSCSNSKLFILDFLFPHCTICRLKFFSNNFRINIVIVIMLL